MYNHRMAVYEKKTPLKKGTAKQEKSKMITISRKRYEKLMSIIDDYHDYKTVMKWDKLKAKERKGN